ncbi:MAG: hypothetical protein ABIR47_14585 [Candidatus Kapaibacterium sp.]
MSDFFYHDFQGANKGRNGRAWRFRLVIMPAGPAGSYLTKTGIPAWSAVPAPGSNFERIPGRVVITPPLNDEDGYGEVPIGLPTLPTLKLSLNLYNLNSTASLRDLRSAIVSPRYVGGGVVYGRTFPTATLWTLYTDRGNAALAISAFKCVFDGVQQKGLSDHYSHDRANRVLKIEVELVNVLTKCMRDCLPADVAAEFRARITAGGVPTKGPYRETFDAIWQNPAADYTYYRSQYDRDDNYQEATMVRHIDLWYSIATALSIIYRCYHRNDPSVSLGRGEIGIFSVYTTTDYYDDQVGTPLDTFALYKRSYLPDGSKGATLTPRQRWLPGLVALHNAPSDYISGYIVDRGTESTGIFRYKSMYEYIDDAVLGGVGKAIIDQLDDHQIIIYLGRIRETYGGTVSVSAGDFLKGDEWDTGGGIQMGGTVDVHGVSSDDQSSIAYTIGAEADPDISMVATLHNMPDCRTPDSAAFDSPTFSTQSMGVRSVGFRENCLYYIEAPAGISTTELPILLHHYVGHHNGVGYLFDVRELWSLPTPVLTFTGDFGASQIYQAAITYLGGPSITAFIEMQEQACIPYAAARAIPREFSADHQTVYDQIVPADLIWYQDIGRLCNGALFPNANIFLPAGETWLSDIPGSPIVLRVQDDYNNAVTKVKLFAQG